MLRDGIGEYCCRGRPILGSVACRMHSFFSPILADASTASPPLTWIESMALGVPVVTTNVAGVSELVSDGHTGYTFKTAGEAVQKIRSLLENENLRGRISRESREFICAEYDIGSIARKYKTIWTQMCE